MTWFFACFSSGKMRIFSQPTYYTTFLGESSKITKKLRRVQQNANLRDSVCWEVTNLSGWRRFHVTAGTGPCNA